MEGWARNLTWFVARAIVLCGLAAFFLFFIGAAFQQAWMIEAGLIALTLAGFLLPFLGIITLASNMTTRLKRKKS